ncbi:MAG: (Fe-S)-binding protein [Rikenella sp.]|nr:(Fe-S)-binding protein [Rikenella sp.]
MQHSGPWYFDPFVIPFTIGVVWLFGAILYKWIGWFLGLPAEDKALVRRNFLTAKSLRATKEVVMECLIHRRIWKTNPMLGFMHMSLALGWFLLIVVGKLETSTYIHDAVNPPHVHVFFRYFFPEEPTTYVRHFNYALLMDCLLIFVLCGVGLAWGKRVYSRMMGMRRTTRHTPFDRIALTSLWLIFPLRYLAESVTCGVHDSGSFFTGGTGDLLAAAMPAGVLAAMEYPAWWAYSIVLGLFFVSMPYSRYMHIFTEVPLIFLRAYRVKSKAEGSSFDQFQIQACSRCGICLDPCPIASDLNINDIQAAYFLRDRRYGHLTSRVADTCLMCGRCAEACPVGIDQGTLRLSSRVAFARQSSLYDAPRYEFLASAEDRSEGTGRVGFFAGCMTQLTPGVMRSMEKIFAAAGVDVWWADRNGGVCCGRPMRLSGNLPAAEKMQDYNTELFRRHGITTLVTGCPICYKSFTQEYKGLKEAGIRVLHHTQYIAELIAGGRLKTSVLEASYAYHDPCELRGIHSEPRYVLSHVATLMNGESREKDGVHCCGGGLANLTLDTSAQAKIGARVVDSLLATGAETIVTSCPQCKKSLQRSAGSGRVQVRDIAEVVAEAV